MSKDTSERTGENYHRARRKIIGEVIEDHTILIFKLALARRLAERIMQEGLMTNVYDHYADLERIMRILEKVHVHMGVMKKWLLEVHDEVEYQAAAARAAAQGES